MNKIFGGRYVCFSIKINKFLGYCLCEKYLVIEHSEKAISSVLAGLLRKLAMMPTTFIETHCLSLSKAFLIGMESIDDATGFASIRYADTLHLKMGLCIRENRKEIQL